jgi:periplasmic protein TonB
MSTLSFSAGGSYGAYNARRAVVRQTAKSAPRANAATEKKAVVNVPLAQAVARNTAAEAAARKAKISFALLAGGIIALHAAGYYWLTLPSNAEALAKLSPLSISIAPPPPPPIEKPKPPEPKIVKVVPQKVNTPPPDPALPVVNTPIDPTPTSANTVAVAQAVPPAPPPPPPPPEPRIETISEPKGFAGYKNNPPPNYPAAAQRRGLEGKVLLRVHVLANGSAGDVKVAQSSGQPILDDEAVKTVLKWEFEPAKRGKTPIDGYVTIPIIYKL